MDVFSGRRVLCYGPHMHTICLDNMLIRHLAARVLVLLAIAMLWTTTTAASELDSTVNQQTINIFDQGGDFVFSRCAARH